MISGMAQASTLDRVLHDAADAAGVGGRDARLIRNGSHAMYLLGGDLVARVGRPGTADTAWLEVQVSRWLNAAGLPTTRAVAGVPQPVVIDDHPVTWWDVLPAHRHANAAELGGVLRELHALPVPDAPDLPTLDPFVNMADRIEAAHGLTDADRLWLSVQHERLKKEYDELTLAAPRRVVHGDAWQGNIAVPKSGVPILLDLEHVSVGNPDWDLIALAVDHADFARVSESEYASFVHAYGGHDVTRTPGFRVLADIQELRWTCFVLSKSADDADAAREVRHRIACLRGDIPRPWSWTAF
jgi:aminoglycoside phosphotransferase (APT) family kinase protein